jgi:phosphoribosyl 1,2-cyclic phosphate phosphodiesterase
VPRIGGDWGDCDPNEPRNRRTRASLLVSHDETRILVDTGPDMREQLLSAGTERLDAVIWTHDHADHTHGIDDLRQVFHAQGRPVRGFARRATMNVLLRRFGYVFAGGGGYPPVATIEELPDAMTIGSVTISSVDQPHGDILSAGLRFEADGYAVGYATDFSDMTPAMRKMYHELDVWIVDALRRRPHPSHPALAAVLGWIGELRPREAALIHMDQSMDYATLLRELPPHVVPGHDGLEFGR